MFDKRALVTSSTWARRRAGLGDSLSDTISMLSADEDAAVARLRTTEQELAREQEIHPSLWTNYSTGMLRGWIRVFSAHGYATVAATFGPGTLDPEPTDADWRAFDAKANELGAGGGVALARKHARRSSSNFIDKATGAASTFFRQVDQNVIQPVAHPIGDALHQLDKLVLRPVYQPVTRELAQVEKQLDRYVPGWSVVVDLLTPALPFVPLLTNSLALASGLAPATVGSLFDTLVNAGENISTATGGNVPLDKAVRPLGILTQNALSNAATYVARVGAQNADALRTLQAVTAKAVATATTTRGDAIAKLEATTVEAAHSLILALQVASAVAGPEAAAALQGLALSLNAALAGAEAKGDATAKLTAAGWVVAKGAPALLLAAGAAAASSIVELSQPIVVGGSQFTTAEGVVVSADPLFVTNLAAIVRGIASLEGATVSAAATLVRVKLAADQVKRAADRSRARARLEAAQLDDQAKRLEAELATLQAELAALAKAKRASRSSSPGALASSRSLLPTVVLGVLALLFLDEVLP